MWHDIVHRIWMERIALLFLTEILFLKSKLKPKTKGMPKLFSEL